MSMQRGNPMGLKQLEWIAHGHNRWIARLAITSATNVEDESRYRRYAHVNILPFHIKARQGKVFVEFQGYTHNYEQSWHDSIDAGKLYVEAIFALDN